MKFLINQKKKTQYQYVEIRKIAIQEERQERLSGIQSNR
jgi:hypothetical protein